MGGQQSYQEQQKTVADYMEASSITTVDSLAFVEDTDWMDEIWGPDSDKARHNK